MTDNQKYDRAKMEYCSTELSAREVAAQRKLLKNGKAYGFDDLDNSDIERNLKIWESRFRKAAGVSYDEGTYKREI